jgi:hypothetical protein
MVVTPSCSSVAGEGNFPRLLDHNKEGVIYLAVIE